MRSEKESATLIEQFEKNGFRILGMKMLEISSTSEQFYRYTPSAFLQFTH